MPSISFTSINIERSKHLDTVVPFLQAHPADVVALQEVMEQDIPLLESATGGTCFFTQLCVFLSRGAGDEGGNYGQAIFSRMPFLSKSKQYYAGEYDPFSEFGPDKEDSINRIARALSSVILEKETAQFVIATT